MSCEMFVMRKAYLACAAFAGLSDLAFICALFCALLVFANDFVLVGVFSSSSSYVFAFASFAFFFTAAASISSPSSASFAFTFFVFIASFTLLSGVIAVILIQSHATPFWILPLKLSLSLLQRERERETLPRSLQLPKRKTLNNSELELQDVNSIIQEGTLTKTFI